MFLCLLKKGFKKQLIYIKCSGTIGKDAEVGFIERSGAATSQGSSLPFYHDWLNQHSRHSKFRFENSSHGIFNPPSF
jgi:hypothetical protein